MRKIYCTKCKTYKEFRKLKMSNIWNKTLLLLVFIISAQMKMKKYLKKKNKLKD